LGHDIQSLCEAVVMNYGEEKNMENQRPSRDRDTYRSIIAEKSFSLNHCHELDIKIHDPSHTTTLETKPTQHNHIHKCRTKPTTSAPPSPSNCYEQSDSGTSWSTTATARTAPCASRWPGPWSNNSPSPSSCRPQCCSLGSGG